MYIRSYPVRTVKIPPPGGIFEEMSSKRIHLGAPPIASGSDALAIETLLEVLSFVEVVEFGEHSGHGKWSTVSKAFLGASSDLVISCRPDFDGGAAAITSAAHRFKSLTAFDLTKMGLTPESFPEAIVSAMTELRTLNLSGESSEGFNGDSCWCDENKFPGRRGGLPDFSRLTTLTTLGLNNVDIMHESELLPIRCLVHLTDLDLSYNRDLYALPDWIGELAELVSLNLNCNSGLGWIPPSIGNLRKLERLYVNLIGGFICDGVGSACLPDEICSLVSLEVLDYWAEEVEAGGEEEDRRFHSDREEHAQGPALPDAIGMLTGMVDLHFNCNFPPTDAVTSGLAALRGGGCTISTHPHTTLPVMGPGRTGGWGGYGSSHG